MLANAYGITLLRSSLLILFALLGPRIGGAAESIAASNLNELLSEISSFQANFVQTTLDAKGNNLQESTGSMAVKRPGMLHWQTEPPFAQTVVSNGKRIWLFDPDLEQVTVQDMDQRINQTPALLLSGETEMLAEFYDVTESGDYDNQREFVLIPTGSDSLFEQLQLTFVANQLVQMRLNDSLGQRSFIEFVDRVINPELDESFFSFVPPKGIDVIDQ